MNVYEGMNGGCGFLMAFFLMILLFLGIMSLNHLSREATLQREHEIKMEELRHK